MSVPRPAGPAARLDVPRAFYSREAARVAAHVLEPRAEVRVKAGRSALRVTLTARRPASPAELDELAGEFFNELLNQEYRLFVSRFNARLADLVATQSLYYARGGASRPRRRSPESSRAFQAEVGRLLKDARAEIARSQPRRARQPGPRARGGA